MALERLGASLDHARFQQPEVNPYISTPEQLLALRVTKTLDDEPHKHLYMTWCKHLQPALIERALSYVSDANARNKPALFAWKIKQLRQEWEEEGKNPRRELPPTNKSPRRATRAAKPPSLFADFEV